MLEMMMGGGSSSYQAEERKAPIPAPKPITEKPKPIVEKPKPIVEKSKPATKVTGAKPSFKVFINGVTSLGTWQSANRDLLVACLEDADMEDAAVRKLLATMSITDDIETVYLTLLAWYILEEVF